MDFTHRPVMLEECMEGLAVRRGGVYLDGTVGGAGHSLEIVRRLGGNGRLICLDRDPDAVAAASGRLAPYPEARVIRGDFARIPDVLRAEGVGTVDGILLDLGVSSHQIDVPERGFSYSADAPLDMRMSREGETAADILNTRSRAELARIFRDFGEEKFSLPIAENIVRRRAEKPFGRTGELTDLIYATIPAGARRRGGHPAKRVFQALRIAVNDELNRLSAALELGFRCLASGGRFVILTFHSLEDRMVKRAFGDYCRGCVCPPDFPVCVCGRKPRAVLVNRKPLRPSPGELDANRRSRPARLRILEKL